MTEGKLEAATKEIEELDRAEHSSKTRGLAPTRKPPSQIVCPLTKQIMVDPVVTADGHTYERSAIESVFAKTPT